MKFPKMKQQTQRRLFAAFMFFVLAMGAAWLVSSMLSTIEDFKNPQGDAYVKGVILTALSGALGTVLTLLGIIVKGVIDNLTARPLPGEDESSD